VDIWSLDGSTNKVHHISASGAVLATGSIVVSNADTDGPVVLLDPSNGYIYAVTAAGFFRYITKLNLPNLTTAVTSPSNVPTNWPLGQRPASRCAWPKQDLCRPDQAETPG